MDLFGYKVINERMEGNHWVKRHDIVKAEVNALCAYTGLPAECEAYGVFSHLIPQQPLNRLERFRERQVLRPDFILQVPDTATGVNSRRVADVKTIGLGAGSYYKPGAEGLRAVERRSRRIQAEYEAGARRGDELAGAQPGQGRVSQKLAELGPVWDLTTGGYFEGSEGVHKLVKEMMEAWCRKQLLATGRPPGEGEKSMTTGLLRRRLSTAIVKANISVVLSRGRHRWAMVRGWQEGGGNGGGWRR